MSPRELNKIASVPRSPKSARHYTLEYYLNYHREAINEYHYYSYYDYRRLFTKGLFAMAEQSDVLQFGMAAMSALIYSRRLDSQVKPVAFGLYSLALRELQGLLDRNSLDMAESQIAMASAMQLSSFDVQSSLSNTDCSVLLATILNAFDIWKVPHSLCCDIRARFSNVQP